MPCTPGERPASTLLWTEAQARPPPEPNPEAAMICAKPLHTQTPPAGLAARARRIQLLALALAAAAACGCDQPAGKCAGVVCVALDQCHTAGVCDTRTGACTNPTKPEGVACEDENPCTKNKSCRAGSCVGEPLCSSLTTVAATLQLHGSSCTRYQDAASGLTRTCFADGTRWESQPLADRQQVRLFGPGSATATLVGEFSRDKSVFRDGATDALLLSVSRLAANQIAIQCDEASVTLTSEQLAACAGAKGEVTRCSPGACP